MSLPDRPYRVVIEHLGPSVDRGTYPIKRVPGEPIEVTVDVFGDGHDIVRAVVRYRDLDPRRAPRTPAWHEVPLEALPNDAWTYVIPVEHEGWIEYQAEALGRPASRRGAAT